MVKFAKSHIPKESGAGWSETKSQMVRVITVFGETWTDSDPVAQRRPVALGHFLRRNNRGFITGKFEL